MKKNLKCLKPFGYCLLLSFLFLLICSKNSFLYQINTWKDANAFFTVGKEMIRGGVPYKTIFEQKGPLLYIIYGIGSVLNFKSFGGVFVFEVLFFSIFLLYAHKTICLFIPARKSYFLLPFLTLFIVTLKSFSQGGSAEEFILPFMMITLYYFVSYLKTDQPSISKKRIILSGVMCGCVFWIKYTLIGLWFGFMASLFLIQIINKRYKEAFLNCFLFLFGVLLASIPWLIYFAYHHAIKDLWNVYFLINIKAYPSGKVSFLKKLMKTGGLIAKNTFGSIPIFLGVVLGFLGALQHQEAFKKKFSIFYLAFAYVTTGLFIFIGGTNYHYYSLPLSPFILVGLILLFHDLPIKRQRERLSLFIVILVSLVASFYLSSNPRMIRNKKEDYAQYKFADIIKKKENAIVLNYGFLDGGFYLTTESIPSFYHFMKTNIPYKNFPEEMDEQNRYIKEKIPDFVIVRNKLSKAQKELLESGYKKIASHAQNDGDREKSKYYLYEKK